MHKTKLSPSFAIVVLLFCANSLFAQDTVFNDVGSSYTLTDAIVRNNFDYKEILKRIKEDISFYKAFKTLRTIGYTSYNHIEMKNKGGAMIASLDSKTRQNHFGNCRTMDVLEERIVGDIRKSNGDYNYLTAALYASLFFTKKNDTVCNETNVVTGKRRVVKGSGLEKNKEQLKMLFLIQVKK